jgi:hypothetical protein
VRFAQQVLDQDFRGHLPEILIASGTQGDQPGGFLFVTYNNQIRPL